MTDMETSSFSSPFLYMSEDFRQFSLTVLLVPLLSCRPFASPVPRFIAAHPASFHVFPLSSSLSSSSHFFSPLLRSPPLARTVTIRGEERPAEFPSTPGISRTCDEDQTFIRHDQNAYPPSWPSTKRVCEKNLRVRSYMLVILRTIETRCPSVREDREKIWWHSYTHEWDSYDPCDDNKLLYYNYNLFPYEWYFLEIAISTAHCR